METFWDSSALWYGGIALFAMIATWAGLRTARGAELKALRQRLRESETAKTKAERSLEDGLIEEKRARHARDAAVKDLEDGLNRIQALDTLLREQEKLLRRRDEELKTLRFQVKSATARPAGYAPAQAQDESALRKDLAKKTELLHAKEAVIKNLETNLSGKVRPLEQRLAEQEKLLKNRDSELEALRAEANTLTKRLTEIAAGKDRAESLLQQELEKNPAILQRKDAALQELKESLSKSIQALERRLLEKEGLLKDRDAKLEALHGRLGEAGSASSQAESLRQELMKTQETLEAREAEMKKLKQGSREKVHTLEVQLAERETLVKSRDAELGNLRTQLAEIGSARERAENLLQQALNEKTAIREAKDSAVEDLEVLRKVRTLETLLHQGEELLKARDGRIEKLTSELKEKRTLLAKHEREIRQELERRSVWKHRFAKLGIQLKD